MVLLLEDDYAHGLVARVERDKASGLAVEDGHINVGTYPAFVLLVRYEIDELGHAWP
jgi:hypothetical protein